MRFSKGEEGGGGGSRGAAYCNVPLISTNQLQNHMFNHQFKVWLWHNGFWQIGLEKFFFHFCYGITKCLGPNFIRSVVTEMQISKTCCVCCR